MEIEKLLLQYRQFSMLNVRKRAPKNTCSHTCYPGTENTCSHASYMTPFIHVSTMDRISHAIRYFRTGRLVTGEGAKQREASTTPFLPLGHTNRGVLTSGPCSSDFPLPETHRKLYYIKLFFIYDVKYFSACSIIENLSFHYLVVILFNQLLWGFFPFTSLNIDFSAHGK